MRMNWELCSVFLFQAASQRWGGPQIKAAPHRDQNKWAKLLFSSVDQLNWIHFHLSCSFHKNYTWRDVRASVFWMWLEFVIMRWQDLIVGGVVLECLLFLTPPPSLSLLALSLSLSFPLFSRFPFVPMANAVYWGMKYSPNYRHYDSHGAGTLRHTHTDQHTCSRTHTHARGRSQITEIWEGPGSN